MHQEHIARPKLGQKVLRPASHAADPLPCEPTDEIGRERVAQVRSPQNDIPNSGSGHGPLQALPLVFDFGKFWHSL